MNKNFGGEMSGHMEGHDTARYDHSSAYEEAGGTMTDEEQLAGYQAYIDEINRRVKAGNMPTKDELARRNDAREKMDALLVKKQFPQ